MSINLREAFWRELRIQAAGGTKEEPATEKEKLAAQRIVADRVFPKLKPVSQRMNLALPKDADMETMLKVLIGAAMTGTCDPEVATEMVKAIGAAYSVKANNELAERFKLMEEEFAEFMRWKVANSGGDEVKHEL